VSLDRTPMINFPGLSGPERLIPGVDAGFTPQDDDGRPGAA
jgi:hypothetical protein